MLCLDRDVFDALDHREIPSVFVDPSTIANTNVLRKIKYRVHSLVGASCCLQTCHTGATMLYLMILMLSS